MADLSSQPHHRIPLFKAKPKHEQTLLNLSILDGYLSFLFSVFISLSQAENDCYMTGSLTSRNTIRNIKEKF